DLHIQLEHRMAEFFGTEAVLLFSTGYQTAQGIIPTLVQKGEYVISDKDNHACIVAADLMAKGAFAEFKRYKHNEMDDLEAVLKRIPKDKGKLIVTDGVFSTTGELVNLPRMIELAEEFHARVMVDDAHAVGVIGKGGRGTGSHYGLMHKVDITMGTFSKTFASLGGFMAASERVINYVKHHAPALIFSASPTPASCAAAMAALEILEAEPWRVDKLIQNADHMREGFTKLGFKVIDGQTGIVPVVIGDDERTFIFWRKLFDAGVFTNAFISPGVPPGMAMLRTSYMSTHEPEHLDRILELSGEIGKELGII
ncbi:MAG TPA: aminotransferase class I/II-fold pyridoxal phosphate-dependent enzyme, partial [Ignavibacteria bacterium]